MIRPGDTLTVQGRLVVGVEKVTADPLSGAAGAVTATGVTAAAIL
jgi:hypothetical protein